jgi:TolA-binding protein
MSDQGFDQQPGAAPPPGAPVSPQYPAAPVDPGTPPVSQYPPQPAAAPQPQYAPQPAAPAYPPQPQPQPQPGAYQQPQPRPGVYGPQPQPGAYGPPQYAPQPGAPQYGPPAQPPKKKGKAGLIVGIIVGLLLCGIVSCGVLGTSLFKSGSGNKSSIGQAEQHFSAAMTKVDSANTSIKTLGSKSSPSKVAVVVTDTNSSLRSARDEIAAAKSIADGWSDNQGKTDYQAGLSSANDALDSMQDLVAYLDTASGMMAKTKQATSQANQGIDALNAAVSAGNGNHYSTMSAKALAASGHYTKAAQLFREAHKLDKSAGLDKAARYCDLRRRQAAIVVRMASEGTSHRVSAYNADIKRMKTAGRAADKLGAPAIVSDTSWADKRLAALSTQLTDAAGKADELRAKALKELGYTN